MSSNKLIHEKSPYLLQHAHNPVNWHAWNEEAFERARTENKPIMLSIGYATCHWCHVMERESFEDEEVARHLNEAFVCIKVDREERPDIDAVYMTACQMLTGSGGWPLNVFLTPQKKPFFAATYIPKESRLGRIGLIELTRQIKKLWETEPQKVFDSATSIIEHVGKAFNFKSADEPDQAIFEKAFNEIARSFDGRHGGFEPAPKFPMPHRLLYLLRCYARTGNAKALEMVEKTLTAMHLGGIWDHIGFGFHRYSTDKHWLLPHFEKMLYDQALIAPVYLEAYQVTHNPLYAGTAEDIFTYVLRDMTSPEGAFYSAEDADSDGEEGKFYIWSTDEFREVLQDQDARLWEQVFNLNPYGNFFDEASGEKNGMNIPHLAKPLTEWAEELGTNAEELYQTWDSIRTKLYRKRESRNHPLKDDKILTDWNGLMIAALAVGARVLGKPDYAEAARKSVRFILDRMRKDNGQLWHRHRDGETSIDATANDYAFLIYGLLQLYQTTFDMALAETAVELQEQMLTDFWDKENGGFFLTTADDDALPIRPKELYDGALPSANSVAFHNLLNLSRLTGNPRWKQMAQEHLRCFAGSVTTQPAAFTFFLIGLDFAYHPGQEIIIAGNLAERDTSNLLSALNLNFSPNQVTQVKSDQNADRLAKFAGYTDGLQVIAGQTTAHLCKGFACKESTSDVETLMKQLQQK